MNKTNRTLTYLINLCFFLYFIILIVERALSVILSLVNGIDLFGDTFHGFTYGLVFASFLAFIVYVFKYCKKNVVALFKFDENITFLHMCAASGLILISGMVHTEYTIPVIQFISYGILIIGILLQVIINQQTSENKVLLWLSFIYLVAFSMAIPVMYQSLIELHVLFHIIEGIAAILLVTVFTFLLALIFNKKDDLFKLLPISLALILDIPLIILRWNESINYFVLIFISLSLLLFIIGFIYKKVSKKN